MTGTIVKKLQLDKLAATDMNIDLKPIFHRGGECFPSGRGMSKQKKDEAEDSQLQDAEVYIFGTRATKTVVLNGRGSAPSMSLLCLNCWDLGMAWAVDNLRLIIGGCKANLAFLSETKLYVSETRDVIEMLNGFTYVFVDSRGCPRGLAMLHQEDLFVTFLSSVTNHIDGTVQWIMEGMNGDLLESMGSLRPATS